LLSIRLDRPCEKEVGAKASITLAPGLHDRVEVSDDVSVVDQDSPLSLRLSLRAQDIEVLLEKFDFRVERTGHGTFQQVETPTVQN